MSTFSMFHFLDFGGGSAGLLSVGDVVSRTIEAGAARVVSFAAGCTKPNDAKA
jgi:hypothetical protein